MKKIILSFFLVLALSLTIKTAQAKTLTPTVTPQVSQESQDMDRIEKIKDLVASKVAELKLVDKRGILGTVDSASNTQITLLDLKNQQMLVDIDELTKFESDRQSFGISDIKKGDILSLVGLFNKDTKRLLARFVSKASNVPLNLDGVVLSKDKVNYLLTIVTEDGQKKVINVESSTKTTSYDGDAQVKFGFTKISEGDRVVVVGFKDLKEDQINAQRIIDFSSLPPSSEMKKFYDLAKEEVPVSTGSGKKLQPITKQ